eukprot:scaffold6324_cov158-Ochromonas_danica.AAC.2
MHTVDAALGVHQVLQPAHVIQLRGLDNLHNIVLGMWQRGERQALQRVEEDDFALHGQHVQALAGQQVEEFASVGGVRPRVILHLVEDARQSDVSQQVVEVVGQRLGQQGDDLSLCAHHARQIENVAQRRAHPPQVDDLQLSLDLAQHLSDALVLLLGELSRGLPGEVRRASQSVQPQHAVEVVHDISEEDDDAPRHASAVDGEADGRVLAEEAGARQTEAHHRPEAILELRGVVSDPILREHEEKRDQADGQQRGDEDGRQEEQHENDCSCEAHACIDDEDESAFLHSKDTRGRYKKKKELV